MPTDNRKKCLTLQCGHIAIRRGLCHECAQSANIMVMTGETTWEELERMGLTLPIERQSSRCISQFRQGFNLKKAEESPCQS